MAAPRARESGPAHFARQPPTKAALSIVSSSEERPQAKLIKTLKRQKASFTR
jgi:hypothetical protein